MRKLKLSKFTNAGLLCDFYKVSHREQYPKNTEVIYSTWTPRLSRIQGIDKVIHFGLQAFILKYLIEYFDEQFFERSKFGVVVEYKRVLKHTLGIQNPETSHLEALHDLGYLPILINSVPEGTRVPIRTPAFTIENTKPEFFWLTNFLETLLSCEIWGPSTSATISAKYREILDFWANKTSDTPDFVAFQGHDFSFRGMSSLESAQASGAGHLLSFSGTDTIPAINWLEYYYNANIEKELVGTSIPASEHSIMEAYGRNEYESFKRIITEVYPSGFCSIVSDTWDLWNILTNTLPSLKSEILARDGKVVIRPDSGDPVLIITGNPDGTSEPERKGVVQLLWETFGGTINSKGYKVLDSHIGTIYGDAITLERADKISALLEDQGFASTNVVYGIGSYTYQYQTRDTFGFALKTTYGVFGGEEKDLFKDPVTDSGKFKKSQLGRVYVRQDGTYLDGAEAKAALQNDPKGNLLQPVFRDGKLLKAWTFQEVKNQVQARK